MQTWVALPVRRRLIRLWLPWPWIGSIKLSSASPRSAITFWGPCKILGFGNFTKPLVCAIDWASVLPWSAQHCRGRQWCHIVSQRAPPSSPPALWSTKQRRDGVLLRELCAVYPHLLRPAKIFSIALNASRKIRGVNTQEKDGGVKWSSVGFYTSCLALLAWWSSCCSDIACKTMSTYLQS